MHRKTAETRYVSQLPVHTEMANSTVQESNIVYDIAYAKTMLLDFNKEYTIMEDLRIDVYSWALNQSCAMKIKDSEKCKFYAVCPGSSNMSMVEKFDKKACLCMISAYVSGKTGLIKLSKNCLLQHSKGCAETPKGTTVIAAMAILAPVLRVTPEMSPAEAVRIVRERCGITLPYHTCWKAITKVKKAWLYDDKLSIQRLNGYLRKVKAANYGTVVSFEREHLTFHRAFLALGVSGLAFPYLLPAVIIDACHMKTKQGGIIFAATGMTTERHNFSLAIAIAPTENENNWLWFLEHLVTTIPSIDHPNVIIMSDRDKGLKAALKKSVPMATTCICLEHLKRNVQAKFNSGMYRRLIEKAADACTVHDYHTIMSEVKSMSNEVYEYLDSERGEWANAFVPVPRFNIQTSNAAESFNSTLENMRNGGYLRIFTKFTKRCATAIYEKHVELEKNDSWAPESVLEKWSKVKKEGVKREIIQVGDHAYVVSPPLSSVIPDTTDRVVDLLNMTCTCGLYQQELFPCLHAAAAICKKNVLPQHYMEKRYLLCTLKRSFTSFVEVVDVATVVSDGDTVLETITVKRGRPKSIRIRSRGEKISNRGKCSGCGEHGHNISTCERRTILRKKRLAKLAAIKKQQLQEQERVRAEQSNETECVDETMPSESIVTLQPTPMPMSEIAKVKRRQSCGVCKQPGHNRSSCPTARAKEVREVVEVSL